VSRARALYFDGPGRVSIRDEALPERVADGEIEVASVLIGISHGTEIRVFAGDLPAAGAADLSLKALRCPMSYPLRYGYINVGTTAAGERVFAFYPHQTRFHVASTDAVALPADVPFDDALFLASMETALSICQDAAPVAGESILVVGQGVIGLLVAEILSAFPLGRIVTLEPHAARRRASETLGCLALDPSDGGAAERLAQATGGRGFDVAVNVSGDAAGLQAAVDALAFGATVVEGSYYGGRSASLRLGEAFHRRRLAIRASQVSTISPALSARWDKGRRLSAAMEMVRRIRPGKYITHRFALEQAQQAFELIRDRPGETLQVVLEP
jgi:2-desacetyl-2-hydroxyethyl bacteriochlorophyllide A dehydrogenase